MSKTRTEEHLELRKAADRLLTNFAKNFAEFDNGWWGYDTNLGFLAAEFEVARQELLRIVNMGKLHEIERVSTNWLSSRGKKTTLKRLRQSAFPNGEDELANHGSKES